MEKDDFNTDCERKGTVREDERQGFEYEYWYCDPGLPLHKDFIQKNPWNDYGGHDPHLGCHGVGLSGTQMRVMPSAEAHFFDHGNQSHQAIEVLYRDRGGVEGGSGINYIFPYPSSVSAVAESQYSPEWWAVSGIYKTFGADYENVSIKDRQKPPPSIFHFKELPGDEDVTYGEFSNTGIKPAVTDFYIFNTYMHHGHDYGDRFLAEPFQLEIPYVSDYLIATPYYPYPYQITAAIQ